MNPSDSKTLEEIEARNNELYAFWADSHDGVEARVFYSADGDVDWLLSKVKEQDREIAELEIVRKATQLALWQQSDRTEKAEAELEAQLITYQAKIKEIDALEARIQELEQELLWAADACEKAETENSILRGLSQKGTIDRGSFAEYATETVETSEETRCLLAGKEKV